MKEVGGSGKLAPMVIKLCTKYIDMTQSSGTPRNKRYNAPVLTAWNGITVV
jgi:hypothetical protein